VLARRTEQVPDNVLGLWRCGGLEGDQGIVVVDAVTGFRSTEGRNQADLFVVAQGGVLNPVRSATSEIR